MSEVEHPALKAAYEAETAAVRQIKAIARRLKEARADLVLRERDRDALSSRVARGENLTGVDIRQADEAVQDAKALIALLEDAGPKSMTEARTAGRTRFDAEKNVIARYRRPFDAALTRAEAALAEAREAHAEAKADAETLPAEAQARLDAMLQRHGRDTTAAHNTSEIERIEMLNQQYAHTGRPALTPAFLEG